MYLKLYDIESSIDCRIVHKVNDAGVSCMKLELGRKNMGLNGYRSIRTYWYATITTWF